MNEIDLKSDDQAVLIGKGVQFKGEISVPGLATINGTFEGTLTAQGLIVGETGKVSGQISVETAEVRGCVADHLKVESKLTLRSSGSICGAVSYAKITVEEGGVLTGQLDKITASAPSEQIESNRSGPSETFLQAAE